MSDDLLKRARELCERSQSIGPTRYLPMTDPPQFADEGKDTP